MPVVTIRLLEGRTLEQKRELTKVISEAVSRIAKTPLDGVHVIFEDVQRTDWGRGGDSVRRSGSALSILSEGGWSTEVRTPCGGGGGKMRRGAGIAFLAMLLAWATWAWGGEKKVVHVWHTETEPQTVAAMQEIANDFEKLHPDINIRQEGLAWGDLEAKLTAALAAGAPPEASHGQAFTCASFYPRASCGTRRTSPTPSGRTTSSRWLGTYAASMGSTTAITHSPNTNLLDLPQGHLQAEGVEAAGDLGRLHQGGPGHDGAGCHRPGDPLRPVPPRRGRCSSTSWWRS